MKKNRETWLGQVAQEMRPWFKKAGHTLPPIRMAIGFPSTGKRSRRIGECWSANASDDKTHEIFISPFIDDPMEVAAILAHELIHAAVGLEAKHGPKFKAVALAIGLTGRMTATVAGPEFIAAAKPILKKAGKLPHARLTSNAKSSGPKKQNSRLVKCECPECGYTVRTTRKWLDEAGAPICPAHKEPMIESV